ncbi:MAG TPA: hypothetical protein PKC45_17315, partial [Gemmatales bacterium]|nr:hypothetical protein [Gemmatales bacterium]
MAILRFGSIVLAGTIAIAVFGLWCLRLAFVAPDPQGILDVIAVLLIQVAGCAALLVLVLLQRFG